MPKRVFVLNRDGLNYEPAGKFGQITYCTEGFLRRARVSALYARLSGAMSEATAEDFMVIGQSGLLNAIGAAILARKTGRLNLLLFNSRDSDYSPKSIDLDAKVSDKGESDGKG